MVIVVDDEDRGERRRPDDRRREDHARGDQLHGALRPRADLPVDDARAARRARDSADGLAEQLAVRHRRSACRSRPSTGRAPASPPPIARRRCSTAIDPATRPDDLARPGHMFPLRSRTGGVLVRTGQTEAAVDLARIAGLYPAGVICEVMNEDGTMARVPAADAVRQAPRPADDHRRRPDQLPDAHRVAGEARRVREDADRPRRLPRPRVREPGRPPDPRRAGARRDRRRQGRASCASTRRA